MGASFMDDLEDDTPLTVVVEPPDGLLPVGGVAMRVRSEQELAQDRLRGVEDELFEESMNVTRDILAFAEVPGGVEPEDKAEEARLLEKWTNELGVSRAKARLRVAKASWLPGKDAPIGLKHASTMAVGIIRARAADKGAPASLNIAIVQLTEQPMAAYPVRRVEK